MAATVRRLQRGWEPVIEQLLLDDVEVNLFLVGFLRMHPVDRAHWYGVTDDSGLHGVALVVPDRLVVPFCPRAAHAAAIGAHLRDRFAPCMLVGPRDAGDALWGEWARGRADPRRWYDQRLYVLRDPPTAEAVPGFRRGRMSEWRQIALYSGLMEEEDLGRNPQVASPNLHDRVVRERVRNGRTWVIARQGKILFQINVGTALDLGAQIGGTYVPPQHRGDGLATAGTRAVCQHLLAEHPVVTLHVNEANMPAVRVYEKVGFERAAPFRLITV